MTVFNFKIRQRDKFKSSLKFSANNKKVWNWILYTKKVKSVQNTKRAAKQRELVEWARKSLLLLLWYLSISLNADEICNLNTRDDNNEKF
jgi:hypothetical protein